MTTDSYVLSLKVLGLSVADLEMFDIGGVLDLMTEYIYQNSEHDEEVEASQEDIDNF